MSFHNKLLVTNKVYFPLTPDTIHDVSNMQSSFLPAEWANSVHIKTTTMVLVQAYLVTMTTREVFLLTKGCFLNFVLMSL